jgi:hypothetical protein
MQNKKLVYEQLAEMGRYDSGGDPHAMMDQYVADQCADLAKKDDLVSADIKNLLDECVWGSLCTSFVIVLLDGLWNILLKTESEGDERI